MPAVQQQQQPASTTGEYFSLLANELGTKQPRPVSPSAMRPKPGCIILSSRKNANLLEKKKTWPVPTTPQRKRALVCRSAQLHESETRDAVADEDETYQRMQAVEQAMPSGTAREQLVKFNTFTQTDAAALSKRC
jgi:hypothetical protein